MLKPPQELDELVAYRYPDALWVFSEAHSATCFTIWVLDLDNTYNVWRAYLSLDQRWTLSPVDVKVHNEVNFVDQRRLDIGY
jgi:hypothetical protein